MRPVVLEVLVTQAADLLQVLLKVDAVTVLDLVTPTSSMRDGPVGFGTIGGSLEVSAFAQEDLT